MNSEPAKPPANSSGHSTAEGAWGAVPRDAELSVHLQSLQTLTDEDKSLWNDFRLQRPCFQSPFMSLAFMEHAQRVGRTVEIGIIRQGSQTVGFFPFERKAPRAGVPVAAKMNDVHGVLGADLSKSQLLSVLRQCELDSFAFHAWFGSTDGIQDFSFDQIDSFMADLQAEPGYDLYSKFLVQDRYTLKQQLRKTRKFARDIGPVHLEFNCRDKELLEKLFQWKRSQFQRTHTFDIFSVPWTTELVSSLFSANPDDTVRGVLSVLFVNQEPAAMHVGIREGELLHYWFPVYDPKFARYSPGAEIFLQIADQCQLKESITKIDLGYGEQPYKHKLVNKITPCFCGVLTRDHLHFQARRLAYRSHQMFRVMPFKDSVKSAIRSVFPAIGRRGFH